VSGPKPNINDLAAQLCPECGLCCNGVLFADVELQPGDEPGRLTPLGLPLRRKGRKLAFAQPCNCFDGKWRRIYANRPWRCRSFECGVFKRVQTGQLAYAEALKLIGQVQRPVRRLQDLLRQLGNHKDRLPLTRRYASVMAQPLDLTADESVGEARAQLMLAVDSLMKLIQRDFLN
jgi:uncharacterized protein